MAEGEVTALKEALCNQYVIMKKVYTELEEEREASATAASEALSMILRLQREKAAEKMEACQYKRMAEERLHHAEESIAFLEEIIQQNEMEISSLRYQVETYRQKLTRHGVNIPDVGQFISGKPSCTGGDPFPNKTGSSGLIRRNVSLPSLLQFDQSYSEMGIINDDSPLGKSTLKDVNSKYDENGLIDHHDASAVENHGSIWKEAEELNKKLKELMQGKAGKELASHPTLSTSDLFRPMSIGSMVPDQETGSFSWYSIFGCDASHDSKSEAIGRKSDDKTVSCLALQLRGSKSNIPVLDAPSSSCFKTGQIGDAMHPAGIPDMSEISQSQNDCNSGQTHKLKPEESTHEANNISGMPNSLQEEHTDSFSQGEAWLNKGSMHAHCGHKLPPLPRKASFLQPESKLPASSKETSLSHQCLLGDSKAEISIPQLDCEQLKVQLGQLEKERIVMQEDTERSKEQLMLLRNIFKQLNRIETQMKRSTSKRNSVQDDLKVASVMEAVLSFSI